MGFLKKVLEKLTLGNTLYYPGCLTKFAAPELEEQYIQILNKLNEDFIKIPEFNCCGSPVLNAGYDSDFQNLKEKNLDLFKRYGINKIISNCPSCCAMFKEQYGMRVEHISQTLHKHIKTIEPIAEDIDIVYHDPCHLGRKLGIYKEPREVLAALGFNVKEFSNHHKNSMCCGAGGGLKGNNPKMSNDIAKRLLSQTDVKIVVTTCPLCFKQFKENAPNDLQVYELSELLSGGFEQK